MGVQFAKSSEQESSKTGRCVEQLALLNGTVLRQQIPVGGFTNTSFNGHTVIYLTGLSVCATGSGSASNVFVRLLNADGNGAANLTYDENCGGSVRSGTGELGSYNVASNGRTSILAGGAAGVAYLTGMNSAFILGSDSSVLFGFGESQAAASFTNGQMQGAYVTVTSKPGGHAIVYLISSSKFVAASMADSNPAVMIFEQGPLN